MQGMAKSPRVSGLATESGRNASTVIATGSVFWLVSSTVALRSASGSLSSRQAPSLSSR